MLRTIILTILYLAVFIFPFVFTPFTSDPYEFNKLIVLIILTLILGFFLLVYFLHENRRPHVTAPYFFPLLIMVIAGALSTVSRAPNLAAPFLTPLSFSTLLCGFVLYIEAVSFLEHQNSLTLANIILLGGAVFSIAILISSLNIIPNAVGIPIGTLYIASEYLAIVFLFSIIHLGILLARHLRTRHPEAIHHGNFLSLLVINCIVSVILFAGTLAVSEATLRLQKPVILPYDAGIRVLIDNYRDIRTLFLGTGPGNFIAGFTLKKPAEMNTTPYWDISFTSSSSFFLTLATELGILGAAAYLLCIATSIQTIRRAQKEKNSLRLSTSAVVLATLILGMVLPIGMSVFFILIILMTAASIPTLPEKTSHTAGHPIRYILLFPAVLLGGFCLYLVIRAYAAEYLYVRALSAVSSQNGKEAYTYASEALKMNPYSDKMQILFSKINIALADSLTGKKDATDDERQNIPVLIKQSISHAKDAVLLNRLNLFNWDNLGRIYSSILTYAEGSDTWAMDSFQQKIALDPQGPSSYVQLGLLYRTLNRNEEAATMFEKAIALKPDYVLPRYQLALIYKSETKYEEARMLLLSIKPQASADEETSRLVSEQLKDIESLLMPGTTPAPSAPKPTRTIQPN